VAFRTALIATFFCLYGAAFAQDVGTLTPKALPPLANPEDPALPAK
jgi:penicillin-insensitive murein endopeptidase